MPKGPMINFDDLELYARLDTSFRIITTYLPQHDQIITRLDVKIGNEQYCAAFCSGNPIEPSPGDKILPTDDLMTPKSSIIACINLKVPKTELVKALKELIDNIEQVK